MKELIDFLIKAKNSTYSAGMGKSESSRKQSIDYYYKDGEYEYLDSYFGGLGFSGEEIVYKNNLPIWSMNYCGKTMAEEKVIDIIRILKDSLQLVDEKQPYRGPSINTQGKYKYTCNVEGDINFYRGIERIYYEEKEVYRLFFHGGTVK